MGLNYFTLVWAGGKQTSDPCRSCFKQDINTRECSLRPQQLLEIKIINAGVIYSSLVSGVVQLAGDLHTLPSLKLCVHMDL